MSTPGGYHEYSGGTLSTPEGAQYIGGYHEYTAGLP